MFILLYCKLLESGSYYYYLKVFVFKIFWELYEVVWWKEKGVRGLVMKLLVVRRREYWIRKLYEIVIVIKFVWEGFGRKRGGEW